MTEPRDDRAVPAPDPAAQAAGVTEARTPLGSAADAGIAPDRGKILRAELRRKAIHLAFVVVPITLIHPWLPWPQTRGEWTVLLVLLVLVAVSLDLIRIHEHRIGTFFRNFFGQMIRDHEATQLLGSTYLLIATLLAVDLFPRPIAAAAVGFTVLGDALAALVGRASGRTRFFGKSLEGTLGGLAACIAWASYLAAGGHLSWEVAITGALVASLVELLPIPLDDNLGITLFSGYAMKLMMGLLA